MRMVLVSRYFLCWIAVFFAWEHAAQAAVVTAAWSSAADVPVNASSYVATGNTVSLTLNFAPATGTSLTLVKNTGLPFISGEFGNLGHGQAVELTYNGVAYDFVANYYGGTGNDLVLVWAANRAFACGKNSSGQLGDGTMTTQRNVMVPVKATGVLAGKTILALSSGDSHTLALCSDGTLAVWGGTGNIEPVLVSTSAGVSALHGKRVVAVSAGGAHSLALCSDGTVAAWGSNNGGALGDNSTIDRSAPVAVNTSSGLSALYGKTVVAISAGGSHSLALCSDGTLVGWGQNSSGSLGTGNQTNASVPVLVSTASGVSALHGRTVVAIATGSQHSLVLCSDGRLAAWGYGYLGQLGRGSQDFATYAPVLVNVSSGVSALYGRTVASIVAGGNISMALCTDGSVAAWGENGGGALGNNTTVNAYAPVLVSTASGVSALHGKTVTGISPARALCADGTVAAWGMNSYGQLGTNNTTYTPVPVAVLTTALAFGERIVLALGSFNRDFTTALAAAPPRSLQTLAATNLRPSSVTLNGMVTSPSGSMVVSFDYGTTTAYGSSVAATPGIAQEGVPTTVSAGLTGLAYNTTYHYRVNGGFAVGQDMTFVLKNDNASLSSLAVAGGSLSPVFASGVTNYTLGVPYSTRFLTLIPVVTDADARIDINGVPAASGSASPEIPLLEGSNTLSILVTAADGATTRAYTLTVTRAVGPSLSSLVPGSGSLSPAFASNTLSYGVSVPVGTGTLSLTPTVVAADSTVKINGVAVASGAASIPLSLSYGETSIKVDVTSQDGSLTKTYAVLVTRGIPTVIPAAFGSASAVPVSSPAFAASGRTVHFTLNHVPVPGTTLTVVNNTGLGFISGTFDNLAQGQAVQLSHNGLTYNFVASYYGGTGNDLVLTWAGTRLTGWGLNRAGQLGNLGNAFQAGQPLAGRVPMSLSVGNDFIMLLFVDGTVATWGSNYLGELGNGSTETVNSTPTAVPTAGTALAGKTVVAVSAGVAHCLALCSDGTVVSWGNNRYGQLGHPAAENSRVPVPVTTAGTALEGRTVVAIAAGAIYSVALCSDGTLVAWGSNNEAEVGYSTVTPRITPTVVPTTGTPLEGKTVMALAGGGYHTLVLCSDGTLAGWGANSGGQLGNGTATGNSQPLPVTKVVTTGTVLEGKAIVSISAGLIHSMALCSDGTLAAWGDNSHGQLGNNTYIRSTVPVAVDTRGVLAGKPLAGIAGGFTYNLAWGADGTTVAAWGRNFSNSLGNTSVVDSSSIPVVATSAYFFPGERLRLLASGNSSLTTLGLVGTVTSVGTASNDATLSGLTLSTGALETPFSSDSLGHMAVLDSTVTSITLTPTVHESHATITLNGQMVTSGTATHSIPLAPGRAGNVINLTVTAQDGTTQRSYVLLILCLSRQEQWQKKLEEWRLQHFSTPFDSGAAANTADHDHDGICNLLEYALNLSPTSGSSLSAVMGRNSGNYEYTYTRSTAAVNAGTAFSVQWSPSLAAGSWSANGVTETVLSDDGTMQQVKAFIPNGTASGMFVRLSVGAPPP